LLSGLALLWLAIASPMDGFADTLLTVHMVEHLLLMSAIPMLLLYGLPVVPLLRGLPAPVTQWIIGPILHVRALRSLGKWLPRTSYKRTARFVNDVVRRWQ
jgi:cytochrome c oxidase assembly factor CtaG